MRVGLPRETKDNEYRVAMTPGGAHQLVDDGHRVLVQSCVGLSSGFSDEQYRSAGAEIVLPASDAWKVEIVVKVKEPQP